ncbi:site-2 protease family protein [Labrys neptuniae]|uniref:Site-2 protease family protein n=1 Tax=Labrys neptuniae TaxID=376174 RepID=A0ABV3PID4_9HYPH|nr:site-2 protease family protein [Labrys neptuniae]MDT3380702.1 site-2 protease family protein [Labrys neptuniae]
MSRVAAMPWRLSANFLPILAVFLVTAVSLATGWFDSGIAVFAFVVSGWLISLCLHEGAHALAAYWGGDRSVVEKGYLSLNPLAYADPLTSFGFPLLFLILGGIGLPGGAVYINRAVLKNRHWDAFVALAGPMANLVCLIALGLPFLIGLPETMGSPQLWAGVAFLAALQASAVVLNLLPVPGFDGFAIIRPYLPYEMQAQANAIAPLAMMGFLFLLFTTQVSGAIWNAVYRLAALFDIYPNYVALGYYLFRFWR